MSTVRTGFYSSFIFIINNVLAFSTANPFTLVFDQGQLATVNCSETITEKLEISNIYYHTQSCQHTDIFGIVNLCNGKQLCSFDVTNSNVGSSCGVEETASLQVTFKCIRDGGWSDWTTGCPDTCGASIVNTTRRCDNPAPNKYGKACDGDTVGEVTCMKDYCFYDGTQTQCEDRPVKFHCTDGYIYTDSGQWQTNSNCIEISASATVDVTDNLSLLCNNCTYCTFNLTDSTFNAKCEKCSQIRYAYKCIVAHWSEWSGWTDCSVSCGIGTRSRSRNCTNSLVTADNHMVGCEGNASDWSVCNEDTCPYCPTGSLTLDHPNSTHFNDTSRGTGYVLMGDIYNISCCARIDSWTFMPVNPGKLTIFVLRMTDGNMSRVVGTNSIHVSVSDINQFQTYLVPANESIGIVNDFIIGWFDNNSNIIGYTECQDVEESCPKVFRLNIKSVDVDTELDLDLHVQANRSYELYYSTSNNRKPEINTNNDTIAIPDHSAIDSGIAMISIEDPDIGDHVMNFEMDYFNDFVYFDTKLRSLHVKAELPHIVGQHNTSLSYRLIVVDSCNNKTDLNITIISYNVPPLLTSVPSKVTIQASTAGIDIPFSEFTITDPSGDNITCTIFNNGSDTDHFSLKQEGHNGKTDLFLFLTENYNAVINTSTILELSCTDGTSTANKLFTIDFQNENHVEVVTSKPVKISSVIAIVVPIACVLIIIAAVIVVIIFKRKNKKNDVQKIVEYTKTDENMGISREQNHYAGLGEQDEMEDKEPRPIENAYNPAWR